MKYILLFIILTTYSYGQQTSGTRFWNRTDTATTTWDKTTFETTNRSAFNLLVENTGAVNLYVTTNADTTALDADGKGRIVLILPSTGKLFENITVPWVWIKTPSSTAIYYLTKF